MNQVMIVVESGSKGYMDQKLAPAQETVALAQTRQAQETLERQFFGGPRTPPFGPFLCTCFRNQKIRKSENKKNWASEMISVTQHNSGTNHRNGKWKALSLKDMRWSEFPWRGNFRDKSQKCFGPGISDFPKLSVTALFWCAKGRRPLGPPKQFSIWPKYFAPSLKWFGHLLQVSGLYPRHLGLQCLLWSWWYRRWAQSFSAVAQTLHSVFCPLRSKPDLVWGGCCRTGHGHFLNLVSRSRCGREIARLRRLAAVVTARFLRFCGWHQKSLAASDLFVARKAKRPAISAADWLRARCSHCGHCDFAMRFCAAKILKQVQSPQKDLFRQE